MLTCIPTTFEIHDEAARQLYAKVEMLDDGVAKVEIFTVLNRTSFDNLVPQIQKALSAMDLDGDRSPANETQESINRRARVILDAMPLGKGTT